MSERVIQTLCGACGTCSVGHSGWCRRRLGPGPGLTGERSIWGTQHLKERDGGLISRHQGGAGPLFDRRGSFYSPGPSEGRAKAASRSAGFVASG
jgi:hypothetical protein